jgi:anti-sigma factor RsiW
MSRERFAELLPWYVNGTLSEADRQWVEAYLKENPKARAELDWFRSLQQGIEESAPKVPATIGLTKTMALIRGDQPTLMERIMGFFGGMFATPAAAGRAGRAGGGALSLRPALAIALVVAVVVQAGIIASMFGSRGGDQAAMMRAGSTVPAEEGPVLKLAFVPDAKEADLRLLLVGVQGTIVSGPGQLGDYYVRVPAGKEADAQKQLAASPLVQSAEIVPGLPPRQ